MAPFHFFKISGSLVSGLLARRTMTEPDLKPTPFLPSKVIHAKMNPIFGSAQVSMVRRHVRELAAARPPASQPALLSTPWVHQLALLLAFAEVATYTGSMLKYLAQETAQEVEKIGDQRGEKKGVAAVVEAFPKAIRRTYEAAKAKEDFGNELEYNEELEQIREDLAALKKSVLAISKYFEAIEKQLGIIDEKVNELMKVVKETR
ncbi:hypothetical protein RchiOBHm_Chr1g0374071 [Rosa chinensis]|uniref:Uncharacterized protein n=1 Tax=Rosa chinensis TaxID=74649 RepID=A0A2P6SMA3_ROSCH|nr:hypothetical protein RchiOBHm_Chr1g0374071 [Rosa chinensis]